MQKTLVATLLVSGALVAQAPTETADVDGRFGVDFTNQYFFRGISQGDNGIIMQPWFDLSFGLYESQGDSGLRALDLTFGMWNNLQEEANFGTGGNWYEADFSFGLAADLSERLRVGSSFTTYNSPNGAFFPMTTTAGNLPGFRRVEELSFWGRLDDKDPGGGGLFDGGLQPHAILAFELKGQRDGGNDRGIYAEFGISPSMGIGKLGDDDLTLTLPITAGFSLGDYYERTNGGNNDVFGYLQFGGQVSAPLSFLPARMGQWLGYVGLSLIVLGNNNELRNSGDTADLIFAVGMSTEF